MEAPFLGHCVLWIWQSMLGILSHHSFHASVPILLLYLRCFSHYFSSSHYSSLVSHNSNSLSYILQCSKREIRREWDRVPDFVDVIENSHFSVLVNIFTCLPSHGEVIFFILTFLLSIFVSCLIALSGLSKRFLITSHAFIIIACYWDCCCIDGFH